MDLKEIILRNVDDDEVIQLIVLLLDEGEKRGVLSQAFDLSNEKHGVGDATTDLSDEDEEEEDLEPEEVREDPFTNCTKVQLKFLGTQLSDLPGSFHVACGNKLNCFTVRDILLLGYKRYQEVVNKDTRSSKRPGKKVEDFRKIIAIYGFKFE